MPLERNSFTAPDCSNPPGWCKRAPGPKGSILIVALLLTALVAIGLGSYINLNLTTTRLTHRAFNGYAALNLSEAGMEEAVWSFNRTTAGHDDGWTGWSNNGTSAWRKFEGFQLGFNASGSVKVFVDNFSPAPTSRPKVFAQSTVRVPGSPDVFRVLEVTLRRRSVFANALVANESVVFSGAPSVDAWNSDPDNSGATPPLPYSTSVRTDRGTVASMSIINRAVLINQANIWGYVATGGGIPEVGSLGTVRGPDTPPGVFVDPRRIATDFNADFRAAVAPSDGLVLAEVPEILGEEGTVTRWRCRSLSLSGSNTLTVRGDVTLILTAPRGIDALTVIGNASINIPHGSKLTIYTEGNVRIGGRGIINENIQPISCQIWGTAPDLGQEVQLAGDAGLKCVVYAPTSSVNIFGNGDIMGAVVANRISLTGNAAFHYDESLAYGDRGEPFAIAKWREITSEHELALHAPKFQGW